MYELLETMKLYKVKKVGFNNRNGFPDHYNGFFGVTKHRFYKIVGLSAMTIKYPDIYEALKQLDVPINWNSIHINKNLVCTPHKDKKNVGDSYIISYGDYVGCNLVVDGVEHNTRTGLVFNGFEQIHYNTPLESGTKYSVIFYMNGCCTDNFNKKLI